MLVLRGIKNAFCISEQIFSSLIADCCIEMCVFYNVQLLRQLLQLFLVLYVLSYFQIVSTRNHQLHPIFTLFQFRMRSEKISICFKSQKYVFLSFVSIQREKVTT